MLLDRGSEFDDIEGMERSCADPSRKRCACYFADPSRPDQNASPIKLAKLVFPQYLLDNLGIREIPAKDVISAPGILYRPE